MAARYASAGKTRDALLGAAEAILQRRGLAGFTLDAVASEARVSKGALLHHFPSKDELVAALLRRLLAAFEERVERYRAQESPSPGRLLRAYVRASYEDEPVPIELAAAILVSLAESEALLRLVRDDAERWQRRLLADGIPAPRAALIRQAADAAWVDRVLRADAPDMAGRLAVRDELLALAAGDGR